MSVEKVLLNYDKDTEYTVTPNNTIGATTSTLRTVPTHNDTNTNYVRRFGAAYAISDITNAVIANPRSDGGGVNKWWFEFYSDDDTLMATVKDENGSSTFVDGTAKSTTFVYMKIVWKSGTLGIVATDYINLTTDVDSPLAVYIPPEVFTSGEIFVGISSDGSTWYMESATDTSLARGGQASSTGMGNLKYPYPDIDTGYQNVGGAIDQVGIIDSATYDTSSNTDSILDFNTASITTLAIEEVVPTITRIRGASVNRASTLHLNNGNTVFFNENGSNGSADSTKSWQLPYEDLSTAISNRGARGVAYGGSGATEGLGEFDTTTQSIGAWTLTTENGKYTTLKNTTSGAVLEITDPLSHVYGFIIKANATAGVDFTYNSGAVTGSVEYCTIEDGDIGIQFKQSADFQPNPRGKIINCIIRNCDYGIYSDIGNTNAGAGTEHELYIEHNFIYNNNKGYYLEEYSSDIILYLRNNFIYDNNEQGILIQKTASTGTPKGMTAGEEEHNMFFNNVVGLEIDIHGEWTNDVWESNIFVNNATGILSDWPITFNYCNWYTNTTDKSGTYTSNNEVVGDPEISRTTLPYRLGISSRSVCNKSGHDGTDVGPSSRIIQIGANSNTINGIIIDGGDLIHNGIIQDSTYTETTIAWCTIQNFHGIAWDDYGTSATSAVVNNTIFYNNGDAARFGYTPSTIQENLIYTNGLYGFYINNANTLIDHNSFWGQRYNTYFATSITKADIRNTAFSGPGLYNIYSEVSLIIEVTASGVSAHNCIQSNTVNTNVDITDDTNLSGDPLYININADNENLNIKTVETENPETGNKYLINSICKNASDDSKDIGAWDVTRTLSSEVWKKYQLEYNPENLDLESMSKGYIKWDDLEGSFNSYAKGHMRVLPFKWGNRSMSSEEQYKKIEYFTTLIPTRENGKTQDDTIFRISLLPTSFIDTGTSATVSATGKTITDSSKSWVGNELKGWHVGVKYDSGTGGTLAQATGSNWTLTVSPDQGWTNDEWIGYYFYYNGYYYYILDNQSTVLELSDPDSTLSTATNVSWNIEKYFKIEKNTSTVMTVTDDDSELVAGTYDWYVNFMACKVQKSRFRYNQPGYDFTQQHWKTGYNITFEEVD